ncbi:MAG: ADP-ribosylglycohydrolase [Firmicutes bacterium]|nr:ADP-ribosylglycohydrolase [Bacillota bacterium]MBP2657113.1 ADP-ribosylglycohydrolase [Bacillota bacterium]
MIIEKRKERLNLYIGSLVGLAVGDALGTTLEFMPPGTFAPITNMVGGGPFDLLPGQWTDDTSMALCLAESLVEYGGFNPKDQMERYVRWYQNGYLSSSGTCFDIGISTELALQKYIATGKPFCGTKDEFSAGNGSIMRLAPVPLFFASDPIQAMKHCAISSRTTHGNQECIDACKLLGALILGVVWKASKEEILSPFYHPVTGYWAKNPLVPKIAEIAKGSYKRKEPPEIKGSGYVVDSLEAALWAFYKTESFREGALLAVNLGDDADTTGAVYGQLAGSFYGVEEIPTEWIGKLAHYSTIEMLATKLYQQPYSISVEVHRCPDEILYEKWITGTHKIFRLYLAVSDEYCFIFEVFDANDPKTIIDYIKIPYLNNHEINKGLVVISGKYPETESYAEELFHILNYSNYGCTDEKQLTLKELRKKILGH